MVSELNCPMVEMVEDELVTQRHIGIDEDLQLHPVSLSALPIRFPVLSQLIAALHSPGWRTR
jgi:hypothetical protein